MKNISKWLKKLIHSAFVCPAKHDVALSTALTILLIFSSIMVVSASMSTNNYSLGNNLKEFITNLKRLGVIRESIKQIGLLLLCSSSYHLFSNYFNFKKCPNLIKLTALGVIILLIVAAATDNNTSSNAWIKFRGVNLQPSELAKVMMILLIAIYLCDKKSKKITTMTYLLVPMIFYFSSICIILVFQTDLGSAFCFAGIGALTFLIINDKRFKIAQNVLLVFIGFIFIIYILLMTPSITNYLYEYGVFGTQLARFKSVIDPTWDIYNLSRELLYSLIAIMKGKITGVGIGNSAIKFGYLAADNSDYIFPIIVEETGLIGVGIIFGCYAVIYYRLMRYAFKAKTQADKCILMGTFSYLFIHMFLNIGGVSCLVPLTGVPLLLVSDGGSSFFSIMTLLGISQGIIANINKEKSS